MSKQLFLDLDGVLADFDAHYIAHYGPFDRHAKDQGPFWRNVDKLQTFFLDLPLMPDALELWRGAHLLHPKPIILTGIPRMPQAAEHKRMWVRKHLGKDVPVLTCASRDKCLYGKPGDVLIDDWPKYQPLWEKMGGVFVLHTSAQDSLRKAALLFPVEA